MKELFKIIDLDNKDKIGKLKAEAHSTVSSTKYFPIYMINGKKMIFKPLSKTKPLTTPFFAYSEVYWSYIINKYFDPKAPRYYLAHSSTIEDKYFNKGVLVESLTPNDEKLINLYDYFIEHPDSSINIKDYVNYCMQNYDYTKILSSDLFNNNKEIGQELAYQILLSILRQDQNFHYENINFVFSNNNLSLVPPIDFEFSTPFLYPDQLEKYQNEQQKYIRRLTIEYDENEVSKIFKDLFIKNGLEINSCLTRNICLIVKLYPDIVLKFIKILDYLIQDLPSIKITDPDNYIESLNSDYWEIGHAYFKDKNLEKYEELKSKIILKEIDKNFIFNRISSDILSFSKWFNLLLKIYLISWYNGITDLDNLTIKQLLCKLNINDEVTIEDINIDTKQLTLKPYLHNNLF